MKLYERFQQYSQRIVEYQEQTIQTIRDIASDCIETQKQVIGSFQSQVDRNSGNNNGYGTGLIHKKSQKITQEW